MLVSLFAACSTIADEVTAPTPNAIGAVPLAQGSQDLRDRYIVVLRAGVSEDVSASASAMGGTVHFRYAHALNGFAATLPPQALTALQRNPNVDYIVADGVATMDAAGSDNSLLSGHWGLDRIDQRDMPLNGSYNWTHDGGGVRAYILDTGIRPGHVAFGGRASIGFDAIGDGQNGNDCNGHGTHVAGTVGGAEHGVARATTLIAVRVLNCAGSGSWSQVIAGVDWVTANHVKPAVANMSLGGGAFATLDQAVTNAINAGVTFALSAGNSNADACNASPARTPLALTVGSTTNTDARSSFSNFGTCVDIFAPGSGVTSAWYTTTTATNTISGTSMASPHVAGVAALYLSANPSHTPSQVAAAIINGSTPNKVTNPGAGSPNRLLYSLITSSGGPGNAPPTASFTRSCTNLSCSFNASGSGDTDGNIVSYAWNFGDGSNGSGVNPNKTYATEGSKTVTLTVTDDDGATGTTSQTFTVTNPAPGSLSLSASGFKVKGVHNVNLTWTPTNASQQVQVKVNGANSGGTTPHDGAHSISLGGKGAATYQIQVCIVNGACSNTVSVIF